MSSDKPIYDELESTDFERYPNGTILIPTAKATFPGRVHGVVVQAST